MAEENVSGLNNITIEIVQNEGSREKRLKRNKKDTSEPHQSINITYVLCWKENKEKAQKKKLFEEVMVKNVLNLMKTINPQIQNTHKLHFLQPKRDHRLPNGKGPLSVQVAH